MEGEMRVIDGKEFVKLSETLKFSDLLNEKEGISIKMEGIFENFDFDLGIFPDCIKQNVKEISFMCDMNSIRNVFNNYLEVLSFWETTLNVPFYSRDAKENWGKSLKEFWFFRVNHKFPTNKMKLGGGLSKFAVEEARVSSFAPISNVKVDTMQVCPDSIWAMADELERKELPYPIINQLGLIGGSYSEAISPLNRLKPKNITLWNDAPESLAEINNLLKSLPKQCLCVHIQAYHEQLDGDEYKNLISHPRFKNMVRHPRIEFKGSICEICHEHF
jgi:hypothetical protein